MYHGYSVCYKDKDGFVLPYESNTVSVYSVESNAAKHLEFIKSRLNASLKSGVKSSTMISTPRRFWFDKIETKTVYLTDDERRSFKQILNTLQVKRVCLA